CRAKRNDVYGLGQRHRRTERRAHRERLRREVHAATRDVDVRTKAQRECAAWADLPLALLLNRHRVAESTVQHQTVALNIVEGHHANRRATIQTLLVTDGHPGAKRGGVVAQSESAAHMLRAAAER